VVITLARQQGEEPLSGARLADGAARVAVRSALDRQAVALVTLLCVVWGMNQVVIKIANAGISPVMQAGLRSAGSMVLVLLWCRWQGRRVWLRDGTFWPGLAAGLLFAVEFVLIYWGLAFTTASRAVVFVYTAPFFVALGAHRFVPGDRLTSMKLLGLTAAFVGIVVAFADALRLPTHRELLGDAMCFLGAIAWGATTVLVKATSLARISAERVLLYQLVVSAVALVPLSLLLGEPGVVAPTPSVLAALAYQIVVVAAASYIAWFWLVGRYPASGLAAFTFLTPVFGVAAGHLVLGDTVGPFLLVSLAMIAGGIYLVNRPARRAP
jgi:drug/metabolite transporter (DMT)-like permease